MALAVLGVLITVGPRAMSALPALPIEVPVTARSVSGQFLVHGRGTTLPAPAARVRGVGTNEVIVLRPDLLAVTAERVKRGIERLLEVNDAWRGAVHLQIRESSRIVGPLSIQPRVFRDGWQYAMPVPEEVGWERLVRGLSEVVVLERANRSNAGEECALPPLWLTTGLHELLMAASGRDLVAESGTLINRLERRPDPLRIVRSQLGGGEPMTFGEFSLLTLDDLADPGRFRLYQASTALFTHELLREPSGRASVREFIRRLPESLNWQTVFLRTHSDRFLRLLDIEKWWAVAATEALAADGSQRWPRERVLDRLAEILTETADVRLDSASLPERLTVPLRDLIVSWDYDAQREVVLRKVSQLRALGLRSPPTVAPLVNEAVQVLEDYAVARAGKGRVAASRTVAGGGGRLAAESAARKLAALEDRLDRERRNPGPVAPSSADPGRVVTPPGRPAPTTTPASGG